MNTQLVLYLSQYLLPMIPILYLYYTISIKKKNKLENLNNEFNDRFALTQLNFNKIAKELDNIKSRLNSLNEGLKHVEGALFFPNEI